MVDRRSILVAVDVADGASAAPPALLDVAWREPLGGKGLASELLLLGSDALVRCVLIAAC